MLWHEPNFYFFLWLINMPLHKDAAFFFLLLLLFYYLKNFFLFFRESTFNMLSVSGVQRSG